MINRRRFLERSVLSTGSVIFSSALLQSCTKYGIPLPGGPSQPSGPTIPTPQLGDYSVDWNDAAKTALTTGISLLIPEGGEILSALVDVFWPSDAPSPWDQVKAEVENLVSQKIGDFEYELVSEDLEGLNDVITLYLEELNDGTPQEKLTQWLAVRTQFAEALPHFKASGYQAPLLGLFAQFANMYLAVLRDAVTNGQEWGRTTLDQARDKQNLAKSIQDFTNYVTTTYQTALDIKKNTTIDNTKTVDPFKTVNAFKRDMTRKVLDFRDGWKYFDVTAYPNGNRALPTREIYSDPFGQGTNTDVKFDITKTPPTQPLAHISAWSGKYLDAILMTYPEGGGPGGLTQTPRYGSQSGSPLGHDVDVSDPDNPITKVEGYAGAVVNQVQFYFYNGNNTAGLGWQAGTAYEVDFDNYEILSSIIIDGTNDTVKDNNGAEAANFIVFGFKPWLSPAQTLQAIGNQYVKSPKERSAADFAKAFPKLGISANSITNDLKAARKAYWEALKARAEKLKRGG